MEETPIERERRLGARKQESAFGRSLERERRTELERQSGDVRQLASWQERVTLWDEALSHEQGGTRRRAPRALRGLEGEPVLPATEQAWEAARHGLQALVTALGAEIRTRWVEHPD